MLAVIMNGWRQGLAMTAAHLGMMAMWLAATETSMAQSHAYINTMRSGTQSSIFVQQSVDGEYGQYLLKRVPVEGAATAPASSTSKAYWRGYGIGTTLGLEMMKFVQVNAGHTFVNLRSRDDGLESLAGSRLHAGLRLAFSAPLANLEIGGGVIGSRLDYQKGLENVSVYGSGAYYSLGLNYFLSSRVSCYAEAKLSNEHLVRQGGSQSLSSIDTETTHMGLGFRIWL